MRDRLLDVDGSTNLLEQLLNYMSVRPRLASVIVNPMQRTIVAPGPYERAEVFELLRALRRSCWSYERLKGLSR